MQICMFLDCECFYRIKAKGGVILKRNLNLTKLEMFERDETRYNLFVINCKDDGGLDREEARRRVMARVEVNLIYPFYPAPPLQICWISFLLN